MRKKVRHPVSGGKAVAGVNVLEQENQQHHPLRDGREPQSTEELQMDWKNDQLGKPRENTMR
jgi:hypothetical protein